MVPLSLPALRYTPANWEILFNQICHGGALQPLQLGMNADLNFEDQFRFIALE